MAKVFRLFNIQGNNSITDWQDSAVYGSMANSQIADPDGASARKPITSIPSPFARIDLVKTAFREVVMSGNLDGTSIYHKMVSDALDVAEIFFNIARLRDKFEIIVWDRGQDLDMNNVFGKTLDKYLKSDGHPDENGIDPYNFSRLNRLYLLNYIGPERPAPMNIVGATSPATLFFGSANDLSYVARHVAFGLDRPFDADYNPLYKRDFEFQKYMYALRAAFPAPGFHILFPEVNNYICGGSVPCNCYAKLTDTQRDEIDAINAASIDAYMPNSFGDGGAHCVEILGMPYHLKPSITNFHSDFEIKSTVYTGTKPLALPVEAGNTFANLRYTIDNWGSTARAPYNDAKPLSERNLPIVGDTYPYLTVSDFLSDTIVRIPYEINADSFFNGNYSGKGKSYLLPLTDLFFEFFTTAELQGTVGGKKMIEMSDNAGGGVKVILRIPIQNNRVVEYSRIYFDIAEGNNATNEGRFVEHDFAFALFPNIRFAKDEEAYYRFAYMFADECDADSVTFGRNAQIVDIPAYSRNDQYRELRQYNTYILDKQRFDYIRIKSCVIIPTFNKRTGGTEQFTFAIDFGTTNTHIEYKIGNAVARPLDITEADKQMHLFSADYEQLYKQYFDSDFLPEKICRDSEFSFPTRTALAAARRFDWLTDAIPLAHANVAYTYEKRSSYGYNEVITDLKWSNKPNNREKVKCYIESLALLMRNKVIQGNGNLSRTKVIWFYPISFTHNHFATFSEEWKHAYKKYFIDFAENDAQFGGDTARYQAKLEATLRDNLIPMTESVAPYQYYRSTVGNASDMVSIDIGGGTTDMVIAVNQQVKFITSFRFAANSIFGDGYSEQSINGILRKYYNNIFNTLDAARRTTLCNILGELYTPGNSTNVASFLFSLAHNKEVIDSRIVESTNFTRLLQLDEQLKIGFVIFYAAIIYHLANIMKTTGLRMPRHITFSGNGSKVIQILTTDNTLLQDYTKIIFEKVYEGAYPADGLTILQNPLNPKEATCKGGLSTAISQDYSTMEASKVVLKGVDNHTLVNQTDTYAHVISDREKYMAQTVDEVKRFLGFVFDLNSQFSYKNHFGVDSNSLETAKDKCYRDLLTYAGHGLDAKLREVAGTDMLEETLFFYPLIGVLNNLFIDENN